jgi:hypothetical protein
MMLDDLLARTATLDARSHRPVDSIAVSLFATNLALTMVQPRAHLKRIERVSA